MSGDTSVLLRSLCGFLMADGEPAQPSDIFGPDILRQLRVADQSPAARQARMRHLALHIILPARHLLETTTMGDEVKARLAAAHTFGDIFMHVAACGEQCGDPEVTALVNESVETAMTILENEDDEVLESSYGVYMVCCLNVGAVLWERGHSICGLQDTMQEFQHLYILTCCAVPIRELIDVAPISDLH